MRRRFAAVKVSPESAGNLSAVGRREEIGHFNYGSHSGKETWIYEIGNLISFRSMPYHDYAFGLLKVNRISFSIL